jgi:hypothetical protein
MRRNIPHFRLSGVAVRDLGQRLLIWPNRRISPVLASPSTLPYAYGTGVAPGRYRGDYITAATAPMARSTRCGPIRLWASRKRPTCNSLASRRATCRRERPAWSAGIRPRSAGPAW